MSRGAGLTRRPNETRWLAFRAKFLAAHPSCFCGRKAIEVVRHGGLSRPQVLDQLEHVPADELVYVVCSVHARPKTTTTEEKT